MTRIKAIALLLLKRLQRSRGKFNPRSSSVKTPLAQTYAVLLATLGFGHLHGQTITTQFFDINGATTGSGVSATTYVWSTTATNWTTDSTGASSTTAWPTTGGNNKAANFSAGSDSIAGSFIVDVQSAITVSSITIGEGTPLFKVSTGGNINLASSGTTSSNSLTLAGGTLTLNGAVNFTFGNLYVTQNSILDFGSAIGASNVTFSNIIIIGTKSGNTTTYPTLTINNWVAGSDNLFLASGGTVQTGTSYSETNGSISTGSGNNAPTALTGPTYLSNIQFATTQAQWTASSGGSITPIPEPSTYGIMLIGSCAGLMGWRRWRSRRETAAKA